MIKETENCDIGLALASKKNCDLEKIKYEKSCYTTLFRAPD